jgi:hypothetical protein
MFCVSMGIVVLRSRSSQVEPWTGWGGRAWSELRRCAFRFVGEEVTVGQAGGRYFVAECPPSGIGGVVLSGLGSDASTQCPVLTR